MTTFEMRFSTIKRDSALLDGYSQQRQAIAMLDAALEELKAGGILMMAKKNEIRTAISKLEDAIYTLTASREFIMQMKAANKRHSDAITVDKVTGRQKSSRYS